MTIPPETLKSIAEAMGYEYEGTHENGNVWCSKKGIVSKYNPETIPAQLLPLIPWLGKRGWNYFYYDADNIHIFWKGNCHTRIEVTSEDFPHAVMEAMTKELRL